MKIYNVKIRYAVYAKKNFGNEYEWQAGYKNLTISVKSIYEVYYKAIDEFKSWLKNRNPWLDEALTNRNVFKDVELIF